MMIICVQVFTREDMTKHCRFPSVTKNNDFLCAGLHGWYNQCWHALRWGCRFKHFECQQEGILIHVINHGQQGQQGYLHVFYKSWSGKDSCQGDSGGPFTVDVEGEPSIKSLCHIHILTSTSISSTLQCRPTSPRWSGVLGLWMCRGRSITIIQMIWRWY